MHKLTAPAPAFALALALALAACGKPAAEQPEPQIAGQTAAAGQAAVEPAAEAAAAADDGFPAVPSEAELAAAAAAAGLPVTPENRLRLVCDNGEKLVVRFFPGQGIAILVRGDQNVELNDEPAASGIRFSNGETTLTGKRNDYTLAVGTAAPIQCVAA